MASGSLEIRSFVDDLMVNGHDVSVVSHFPFKILGVIFIFRFKVARFTCPLKCSITAFLTY